ncbi:hypothetical protein [Aliiroseovarius crassostreae]|uniref:hypothetical protein n=1 Tax=Aliiroseovarius crassostreae TaxID=154981 RepID=UPI002203CD56|nr:hypothetical protein [Aliiroseovarius crassostreae]UWQ07919.1 hypothetical protein K3X25_14485 [Aliiroseovarius crassostreae]
MSDKEIEKRIQELEDKVPHKEWGEGVMKHEAPAHWLDYPLGSDESNMLLELATLLSRQDALRGFEGILKRGEKEADQALWECGFPNGVPVRVFWSEKYSRWRRVHPALSPRIMEMETGCRNDAWVSDPRKPWRRCLPLRLWMRKEVVAYSVLETAIEINLAIQEIRQGAFLSGDQAADDAAADVPDTVNYLAIDCINLGRLLERLYWKQNHEQAAQNTYDHNRRQKKRSAKAAVRNRGKAAERKILFRKIAMDNLHNWIARDGKSRIKALRELALKNDPDGLFRQGKGHLSLDWFDTRYSELKQSGEIERALKNP